MASQVASNSDPKLSKGGGGAKKQQGSQGKPARTEIDKRIKQLKEVVGSTYDDDSLERVLEKNDYDTNNSVDYILAGNPIPQTSESNDWQQVTRNSSNKETKAKSTEKRNGDGGNEKKDKSENKGDTEKRNDREEKRSEGRPERKSKKSEGRFKQEGADGAQDGHRGPREGQRDRDPKQNGSPHGRPSRRSSGPGHALPAGAKAPPQQSQQHPPFQSPHPQPNQNSWGPSADGRTQPTQPQSAAAPVSTQPSQPSQAQSTPPPSTRPPFSTTTQATSYSKIVQGKSQPTPPPQSHPPSSHPASHQTPSANAAATAGPAPTSVPPSTTTPPGTTPTKQDFHQSPSGSRAPHRSPPHAQTAWRPKDTSAASPTLSSTAPSSTPASTTPLSTAQSTAAQTPTPPVSLSVASPPQPQTTQVPSQPIQTQPQPVQAQVQPQVVQPAAQVTQVQTQPTPISPPTSVSSQPKRQSVLIDGGNLRLPPSLQQQYSENITFQFGNLGLDSKPKDFVLNLGTQPTNTPSPAQSLNQPTQPIQAQHPTSTTPPPQQPAQTTQPTQPASHHLPQQTQPATTQPAQHPTQQPAAHQHPAQPAQQHPAHLQQHIPSHVPQQQSHLNGEHAGMAGHLVQSPDDMHMQGYPSYLPPGYFHMPAFGFSEGNPDDALRMRSYYDHPTSTGYVAPDSSTSSSTVPQNSQSPPPQSPSQYPMQSYYYPPYVHPGYYQTSAPTQFQQFPGNYMYKPNYSYNRMGGAGGYPPSVHASTSPAGQTHGQYEDSEYSKYLQSQQYSNFYNPSGSTGSGATTGSGQGVQQGSGSSVGKPQTQSFSPTSTTTEGGKGDYNKYNRDPFYNTMSQPQPGTFNQHQQHFMQQHVQQNLVQANQSSAYHSAQPPNTSVPSQSGGTQRYSGL